MQKIKNSLIYLISLNLCFFLISCEKNVSNSDLVGQVPDQISDQTPPETPQTPAETEAESIVQDLKDLQNLLLRTSEGRFVLKIANFSDEASLAAYLQDSEFNLAEMLTWADRVIEKIHTLNTPIVNEKIAEIEALRDATTDQELIVRYNSIIARMQSNEQKAILDIQLLKTEIKKAITNLVATQLWINESTGRRILLQKAYNAAIDTDLSLQRLDLELDRIDED